MANSRRGSPKTAPYRIARVGFTCSGEESSDDREQIVRMRSRGPAGLRARRQPDRGEQ